MSALTFYDWLWISFVVAICLYAVLKDRQQTKRELKDAEDFEQTINELKHKDYDNDSQK